MIVSQEWLSPDDHVLIIDDFMAKGYAMQGLVDLVNAAGATIEGIGVAVEKGFQGGGDKFRASGVPYKALLAICWNSAFSCLYLSFSPVLFASLLFTIIC